ncbi:MAG: HAMP domain-containing histidine kinase [Clostridiales bacterium]|nr:HAMP domain-containing histidine kinase [Clostridiales bacterium]
MTAKRKSVKNYIFFSNALMVLLVLGIFLILNAFVIKLYEYRESNSPAGDSELASGSYEASQLLENYDWSQISGESGSLKLLCSELDELGFYVCVEQEGVLLLTNMEDATVEDFEEMEGYFSSDGSSHVYLMDGTTFITLQTADSSLRVCAIHGEYADFKAALKEFTSFVLFYLINSVLFILILCVASALFAKRISRHIMQPLDALIKASDEMKNGDYSQPVSYHGDWEFEDVCQSFNEMQSHVREADRKKADYEKARTDMIAGISHDLRTPLTAIRGTIKGLQDGVAATPELQKRFLDTAYRRTLEMDQLLEQLFYFSKIETGSIPLYLEMIEWNAFLKDYKEKLELDDTASEVRFYIYGTDEKLYSQIDRQQIERILDNIVENSRKYANVESLTVSFLLHAKDGRVILWVADNGHGVPDEKLPYIFNTFYRADESRNKTEGNGLGLHIVKYLVEVMGGTVEAQNHQGLEIKMTFPAAQEDEDER